MPGGGQDPTGLPLPAIQRLGGIDQLRGKHRLARQVEGVGELSGLLIHLTQVAERIRFRSRIADASGDGRRLPEALLRPSTEPLLVRLGRRVGWTDREMAEIGGWFRRAWGLS